MALVGWVPSYVRLLIIVSCSTEVHIGFEMLGYRFMRYAFGASLVSFGSGYCFVLLQHLLAGYGC